MADHLHHLVPHAALHALLTRLLTSSTVPPAHATTVASALVLADLRGVESHGSLRMPSYLARIRAGVLSPTATPVLHTLTPVVARVEGNNAFGFVAAQVGIDAAVSMAETMGVGVVSVRGSNHFGMSAWIVKRAVERGMMCLVFTNSSPALPPYGAREKIMGVSPIACGAPGGGSGGGDFILDMAPSNAARGKIHKALRRGETIPQDWALDAEGNTTTDPGDALKGSMLPMGGPKGSALAIMMDVFSGVFSGSAFANGVTGPYDPSRPANVGHFFMCLRPDLMMPIEEFKERMDVLYNTVVGAEKRPGVDRVWFPGEKEAECERERREAGIPLTTGEIDELNAEADRVGCERLEVDKPTAAV